MAAGHRKDRLGDQIKDEISRILLYEMSDPRMGFVTVTGVELSGDLRNATVKLSVLGDEKTQAVTMSVLARARGYLQRELGNRINARHTPAISFQLDDSVKKSVHLSKVIREAMEDSNREVSEEPNGDVEQG